MNRAKRNARAIAAPNLPAVPMSNRRLSDQQRGRIKQRQNARATRARDASHDPQPQQAESLGAERHGRVICRYGNSADIRSDDGEIVRCVSRQNLGALVCGDRVVWQASGGEDGVVVAVLARKTLLSRPDAGRQQKAVAANIDQIVIVATGEPLPGRQLIDRYVLTAESIGITPVIVINKTDLLGSQANAGLTKHLQAYRDIGYRVLLTSVKVEHGLDDLRQQLNDRTSILVGQSGVGKSSLVQALLPHEDVRVGALSKAQRGRHTTTTSALYQLPSGGQLIDSPGVRDFGVWHIEAERIAHGFIEFRPFLGTCKFSNCTHSMEPGCSLLEAVAAGQVDRHRLQSYQLIMEAVKEETKDIFS